MGMKWVGSQHQHWSLSQLLPLDVKEKEGLEEEEEEEEEEEVEVAFGGGAHIVVEEADRGDAELPRGRRSRGERMRQENADGETNKRRREFGYGGRVCGGE